MERKKSGRAAWRRLGSAGRRMWGRSMPSRNVSIAFKSHLESRMNRFPYPVVSALRDAEMLAEGRNGEELPGNPGIKKRDGQSQAVGRIGNDN